ncbi:MULTISPECIES: TetR/AcrR family transcriptional regulator [Streptomycetaceae]|uniref:TetR family transcriptional regulator n=1 Tax=Streptantibioticus cattleyicolor (strain ATCC 35852 / DSM 46488 / JCM 4925 / NBRC 14057 / NRRL 8057) TaxID=1003195 RepID=F8JX67_STREN|nr:MULTISPECIES: TetR/AcrR family transcriptional regulator [Streptomycetaceae]AEW94534.1 TetR family transcriptional regulator [Streptantibioticus cattleyicolor NRRL 8057 = DSM 46488]MYS59174.1 TetR family transcriptional regulator [Streptomyces sp. SID5468]CCB74891.1 putative TetR-family transcriptional regulator [Streptantibioticus cattleyicolor NRRL 8057 = DSM 46488]
MGTHQARRGDTRQRIQDVALELFLERGYEKTSLREIAEKLDVTKAALYYHFKTKEDIVIGLFQEFGRPLDELIAWGRTQPSDLDTRLELLRRYSAALQTASPLFRFAHENQPTLRELSIGQSFRERITALTELVTDAGGPLEDRARGMSALFTVHFGAFAAMEWMTGDDTPDDKRRAFLQVAEELLTAAHHPSAGTE